MVQRPQEGAGESRSEFQKQCSAGPHAVGLGVPAWEGVRKAQRGRVREGPKRGRSWNQNNFKHCAEQGWLGGASPGDQCGDFKWTADCIISELGGFSY